MARSAFSFKIENSILKLLGDWSATTSPKSFKQLKKQLQNDAPVLLTAVDWSQITVVDSSSLAMVLWLQSQQDPNIEMIALPEKLQTLSSLYDLDTILSFSAAE